ncbi:hypothetical protein Tco_0908830 [Tanacetum coccineum]|uniref:Uncharacterized protein n=1 Tax=Tanacetum coccineum TaxID=301880 RepID=A0ABQ5CPC9_9ASTR
MAMAFEVKPVVLLIDQSIIYGISVDVDMAVFFQSQAMVILARQSLGYVVGYKEDSTSLLITRISLEEEITRNNDLEESLSMFMAEIAKRHDEHSNLIKEIQASIDFALRNQKTSIEALEIQNELKETDGEKDLEAHYTNAKPFGKALPRKEKDPGRLRDLIPTKLIVELADKTVKRPKGIAENVLVAKITLSVENDKIFFKSNKPTSNIIKRVYALSLIKSTELDLEARLIGNALRKNRSHDPKFEDYIKLSDLNEPLELRHDQVVDLGPTIEEGEVIDTPIKEMVKTRHDDDKITNGIEDYPSDCDHDKKIHINCAYNLKFSCMIGFEFLHGNFFPILYVNVMSKNLYNSIMKNKLEYKGNNVVGALMNIPVFVGKFSILTDFAVLEDMDGYRDKGMGDVFLANHF